MVLTMLAGALPVVPYLERRVVREVEGSLAGSLEP